MRTAFPLLLLILIIVNHLNASSEKETIIPKFPLQFTARLKITSNLLVDVSNEIDAYPPRIRYMTIYYDYIKKKARAEIEAGYEAAKFYIRRYDVKKEYMVRLSPISDCKRSYLGEVMPFPDIPEDSIFVGKELIENVLCNHFMYEEYETRIHMFFRESDDAPIQLIEESIENDVSTALLTYDFSDISLSSPADDWFELQDYQHSDCERHSFSSVVSVGSVVKNGDFFKIFLSYGADFAWGVNRSRIEVSSLKDDFKEEISTELSNLFAIFESESEISEEMAVKLFQLLLDTVLQSNYSTYPKIMIFFDVTPNQSKLSYIQFNKMHQKINELQQAQEQDRLKYDTQISQLNDIVKDLKMTLLQLSSEMKHQFVVAAKEMSSLTIDSPSVANVTQIKVNSPTKNEKVSTEIIAPIVPIQVITAQEDLFQAPNLNPLTPQERESDLNLTNLQEEVLAVENVVPIGLTNAKYLTEDSLPTKEKLFLYDQAVDEIIHSLQPHDAQLQYRASVVSLLRRAARRTLGTSCFEISLQEIRCFLPDDPIRLSVAVSRAHSSEWHKVVVDRLNLLVERGLAAAYPDEDDLEEFKPIVNHMVNNVNFSTVNMNFKVFCTVDSIDIEMVANSRGDLCILAFLEEFSRLVGQNHLFKRSMLLIRSWWYYETASYVGCSIKHYLGELPMSIMICAIFNQYYSRITSPFQALCIFLAEYSNYDGSNYAITLQGIVPFKSSSSSQVNCATPITSNLVNADLIEKYKQLHTYGQNVGTDPQERNFLNLNSSSSEDVISADPLNSLNNYLANAMNTTVKIFDRYSFNIVHPFTNANMITEKISSRRMTRISKAFQIGAANLTVALKQAIENPSTSYQVIRNFFPAVVARFGDDWRPDAIGNSVKLLHPKLELELMNSSIERILQSVQYFDLILESIVTETSLLAITMEVLSDRGPLPIGEIGKILTELCSNPVLSHKLKESFGGLKKFVEKYAEFFVIYNDHPFNPHILLRATLTPQHIEMLERGVFPTQLFGKLGAFKKTSMIPPVVSQPLPTMKKKVPYSPPTVQGQINPQNIPTFKPMPAPQTSLNSNAPSFNSSKFNFNSVPPAPSPNNQIMYNQSFPPKQPNNMMPNQSQQSMLPPGNNMMGVAGQPKYVTNPGMMDRQMQQNQPKLAPPPPQQPYYGGSGLNNGMNNQMRSQPPAQVQQSGYSQTPLQGQQLPLQHQQISVNQNNSIKGVNNAPSALDSEYNVSALPNSLKYFHGSVGSSVGPRAQAPTGDERFMQGMPEANKYSHPLQSSTLGHPNLAMQNMNKLNGVNGASKSTPSSNLGFNPSDLLSENIAHGLEGSSATSLSDIFNSGLADPSQRSKQKTLGLSSLLNDNNAGLFSSNNYDVNSFNDPDLLNNVTFFGNNSSVNSVLFNQFSDLNSLSKNSQAIEREGDTASTFEGDRETEKSTNFDLQTFDSNSLGFFASSLFNASNNISSNVVTRSNSTNSQPILSDPVAVATAATSVTLTSPKSTTEEDTLNNVTNESEVTESKVDNFSF
eukprot:gene13999-18775_t